MTRILWTQTGRAQTRGTQTRGTQTRGTQTLRTHTRRRRALIAVLAALPLLALAVTAPAVDPNLGNDFGTWVLSPDQDCPQGLVCTEWELRFGESDDPACCQDPSMVGSTVYTACGYQGTHFRH